MVPGLGGGRGRRTDGEGQEHSKCSVDLSGMKRCVCKGHGKSVKEAN